MTKLRTFISKLIDRILFQAYKLPIQQQGIPTLKGDNIALGVSKVYYNSNILRSHVEHTHEHKHRTLNFYAQN